MRDPRLVRSVSVLSLFEQQQERLPPALMGDTPFTYDDLPWAATFSVQAQLKRMVNKQMDAIRSKHGDVKVKFKVVVEEGKAKVKASVAKPKAG